MNPSSSLRPFEPWYTNPWWGAALGLCMGAFDTALVVMTGIEFVYNGQHATWIVGSLFSCSYVMLGAVASIAARSRHRERVASQALQARAEELAEVHGRLGDLERLAALGQLAATMAHEVRNPLAIVRASVQNVAEAVEHDPNCQESCQFAIEEIDRLARVTASLAAWSKPVDVHRRALPASELLSRVDLLGRRMLTRRGIVLKTLPPPETLVADVDPDLVCQLSLGLLANAADASPQGGQVTLAIESKDPETLVLSVTDEGPGVPPELENKIFEPFFTTKPSGTGIGLAVARQIAQAHRGQLTLASGASGARFEMEFPMVQAVPVSPSEAI